MSETPAETGGYALLGPCLHVDVERIAHDQHQRIVLIAQYQTFAFQCFGERQHVEGTAHPVQVLHGCGGVMQRRGQSLDKALRIETGLLFENVHSGTPSLLCRCACRVHHLRRKPGSCADNNRLSHIHWMLPASSKIGKYISTTMTPMTSPMNTISKGSNSLVKRSTQRAVSSS